MSKKPRIDAICPHCESELIITLTRDADGEIIGETSIIKTGLKIVEAEPPNPPNPPNPPKSKKTIEEELFGEG